MDALSVAILLVNVEESAFNPNAVLISDVLAFNAIAVFSVFVLLVIIKSFCDFVYTSVEFAFNPIDVLSVDIYYLLMLLNLPLMRLLY